MRILIGVTFLYACSLVAGGCSGPGKTAGDENTGQDSAQETSGEKIAEADGATEATTTQAAPGENTSTAGAGAATLASNAAIPASPVKALSDGYNLLHLRDPAITIDDKGQHLIRVVCFTPGDNWTVEIRPRPAADGDTEFWRDYQIVGKPSAEAASTSTQPKEMAALRAETIPTSIQGIIIHGLDSSGNEVGFVVSVPEPAPAKE